MAKPKVAVFSGPSATIGNSPPLVTSNKARHANEKRIEGKFDHLVPQYLYEPVKVRIRKFSAHPLEGDASQVYYDDGKDYYEVTLNPEDGPYLLPYMARRKNDSPNGTPFEATDLDNPDLGFGGRQGFYPDASRMFDEIDRTIGGRNFYGQANILSNKADFTFIRALPSGGYTKKGEISGVDYFPYKPFALYKSTRYGDLARVTNSVQLALDTGGYEGGVWIEGSPFIEETLYWLSLTIDSDLPIVGTAAQRAHGELSAEGDRNIVDSVDYVISGKGEGLGVVALQEQQIFSAREIKKADDRPGNYKAVGGHGGILGTLKAGKVTIWFKPNYKHTTTSEVNIKRLPEKLDLGGGTVVVKNPDGTLRGESIPRVHIVKHAYYSQEDESDDANQEVDIMARIQRAVEEEKSNDPGKPKLHGFVLEGMTPYARGSNSQMNALSIAAMNGLPVVRVGRSDPGGRVVTDERDLTIEGSNLDSIKARLLLMASMMKLGRLPRARDPRHPTSSEKNAAIEKIKEFQEIFETH